jgi:hypothetical protein
MEKILLRLLFLFMPAHLFGIEFFSSELGSNGTGWLDSSLYDSIPQTIVSLSGFRGYEGTDIHEGVLEFMKGINNQGYGFLIRHQTHELLTSQSCTIFFRRHATPLLRGAVEIHLLRACITGSKPDHELSLSWELIMIPASWMYTRVSYIHKPARSFPEKDMHISVPSWSGSLRFIVHDEAFLQGGVMCRDGFLPDWSAGFGFKGGKYINLTMTRFSLSRALNTSFGLHYRDWHIQWIIRWHPYLGLSGGSAFAWVF